MSGKPPFDQYHGVNFFLLSMMGYRLPNWMTFRQAHELGGDTFARENIQCRLFIGTSLSERIRRLAKLKAFPFLKYFSVFDGKSLG
jgi:antirestriction protein ArdC